MIKEHFSLNKGERYGLFLVISCTLLYAAYTKYTHINYQPDNINLAVLQDSVDSYYASQAKPTYTTYSKEYKKKTSPQKETHEKRSEIVCIELNGATKEELQTIVGVGDFFAKNIIQEREKLGGFTEAKQLENIYGMTSEQLMKILPQVKVDKSRIKRPIKINTADTTQLASVYGISCSCARRIVNYRERLGGFYCLSQLSEVYGLDSTKYKAIQHRLILDTINTHKLDINNITFKELLKHPYISDYKNTKAIFRYLEYGPIKNWEEFCKIPHLKLDNAEGLRNYLVFKPKKETES